MMDSSQVFLSFFFVGVGFSICCLPFCARAFVASRAVTWPSFYEMKVGNSSIYEESTSSDFSFAVKGISNVLSRRHPCEMNGKSLLSLQYLWSTSDRFAIVQSLVFRSVTLEFPPRLVFSASHPIIDERWWFKQRYRMSAANASHTTWIIFSGFDLASILGKFVSLGCYANRASGIVRACGAAVKVERCAIVRVADDDDKRFWHG